MHVCEDPVVGEGIGGFVRAPLVDALTAQLVRDLPTHPQTICAPCCWCIGTSAAVPP